MSESTRPPATPPEPSPAATPSVERKAASLFQVAGAVFWSFFGVRKRRAMQQDTATIKLHHVVLVGIVMAALFVFSLIALVSYITRNAP